MKLLQPQARQPVSVEFDLTLDDYVAFNFAHHSRPALLKWTVIFPLGVGWVSMPPSVIQIETVYRFDSRLASADAALGDGTAA